MKRNYSTNNFVSTVECLGKYDVICGRHKAAFDNVGNRRFRVLVGLSVPKYVNAPSRAHKSAVIKDIVDAIHSAGGRFLQQRKAAKGGSKWEEIDEKQTYDKVGHALRDMSSSSVKVDCDKQSKSSDESQSSASTTSSIPESSVVPAMPKLTSCGLEVPALLSIASMNQPISISNILFENCPNETPALTHIDQGYDEDISDDDDDLLNDALGDWSNHSSLFSPLQNCTYDRSSFRSCQDHRSSFSSFSMASSLLFL
jgi:hypothetical protein